MNNAQILLKHNFVDIKSAIVNPLNPKALSVGLVTIVSNLAYYGYVPSVELLEKFQSMNDVELTSFWKSFENEVKIITGADKEMENFVVYKNFPSEVLSKTEAEYWGAQILMYWGFPNEYFTEDKAERPKLSEKKSLKVLFLSKDNTLQEIFYNLVINPARWTDSQREMVFHLFEQVEDKSIDVSKAKFKENVIELAKKAIDSMDVDKYASMIKVSNATDVLRLASAMSEGDISLRENVKFKKFKRSERRFLLGMLEGSNNLLDDVMSRPEVFKKLLRSLHPGDYSFEKVSEVYNKLYNKDYSTFNSQVVKNTKEKNVEGLELLKSRPGEFFRSFHHMYSVYGARAIDAFVEIIPALTNLQLLKMSKYLESINDRKKLMFAPKGNWNLVKVEDNKKVHFVEKYKVAVINAINDELIKRLTIKIPEGVYLDEKTKDIKLQTNDQELASYGRGTSFDIPENVKFIRSASYQAANGGAIFSGDPTNTKDIKGRACQMIDLYLDKLEDSGIRYAVWNVLAYSKIPFESADVLATLQYGEKAEEGKLYEPSRAQMVFPLQGDYLSKYVAYIDVKERKLVYMDANLYAHVHSAESNGTILSEKMPAFVEYLSSLPSIYDLFKNAPKGETPILYSDKDIKINTDKAFVFKKENAENSFNNYDFNELISEKTIESKIKKKM